MLAAMMMVAALGDWVPARWPSNDPATLAHLSGSSVNCLLMEQKHWSGAFATEAAAKNIAVLGVIRPGGDTPQSVRTAKEQKLTGVVLEGEFARPEADGARAAAKSLELAFILLPPRRAISFDGTDGIIGTSQGLWPGIRQVDEKDKDKAHAMPSGGPWIDTNAGFLRFARAMHKGPFWVSATPPEGQVIPADRYLQAISDSAMLGAHWILTLDSEFSRRLLAGDTVALKDWKAILRQVAFYEKHKAVRAMPPYGQMAVVQDASSGALLSGNVLDMISVKHTPVRPIPGARLGQESLSGAAMAVNLDPEGLTAEQKEALKAYTRSGGTVLNGPPGWKMPSASKNQVTVDEADVEKLDQIWKEMNTMINRRNMGVRLFNVSSMLSYLQAEGQRAVLHLVNYSGYPVENVTAHVLGKWKRAWVETPDGTRKAVEPYEIEEGEGVGLDIDMVPASAIVTLEK